MYDPTVAGLRQPARNWIEDGLAEMAVGAQFAIIGGALMATNWIPQSSIWYKVMTLTWMAVIMVFCAAGKPMIRRIKMRTSYSRAGYVRPAAPSRHLTGGILTAALVTAGIVLGTRTFTALPVLLGMAGGCAGVAVSRRLGVRRFSWIGVCAMLIGVASAVVYAAGYPEPFSFGVFWLGAGLSLVVSGVVAYREFRRLPELL